MPTIETTPPAERRVPCRELIGFLLDYLEGVLPPADRAAFDRHLERCVSCVAYLDSYRRTVAAAKQAFSPSDAEAEVAAMPPELVSAILASRN